MATVIFCLGAIYVTLGIYGLTLIFKGLKTIRRRSTPLGFLHLVTGVLASGPWLIPMLWDMPLDWRLYFTPIVSVIVHFLIIQMVKTRLNWVR